MRLCWHCLSTCVHCNALLRLTCIQLQSQIKLDKCNSCAGVVEADGRSCVLNTGTSTCCGVLQATQFSPLFNTHCRISCNAALSATAEMGDLCQHANSSANQHECRALATPFMHILMLKSAQYVCTSAYFTRGVFCLQDCLTAEQQIPMLPMLQPFLDRQHLVAAHAAVQQFEKLLEQFGGSKERQRWQTWRSKLQIYTSNQLLGAQLIEHSSQNSFSSRSISSSTLQDRVPALQAISAAQKEVFAVGDCLHALTLSANSKATEFAARQGVQLEVFIHRAVWLTGK